MGHSLNNDLKGTVLFDYIHFFLMAVGINLIIYLSSLKFIINNFFLDSALKLDHARVIDTSYLFKYRSQSIHRRPSLNNLCKASYY